MNKGDLNRILNKLTAAANPFLYNPSGADSSGDKACEELEKYNYVGKIVADIKQKMVDDGHFYNVLPNPFDRDFVMKTIYKHLRRLITLYCACPRTREGLSATGIFQNPDDVPYDADWRELRAYFVQGVEQIYGFPPGSGLAIGVGAASLNLSQILMTFLQETSGVPSFSFNFCDDDDNFPTELSDEEAENLAHEDRERDIENIWGDVGALARVGLPATTTTSITPCVTVPVEQIETAFSNIPSIVTMGLVAAGVLGVAFWIRRGNFTKAMAAASAIAVTSGASAAEIQALQNALRGIAGPVMQQAANGQTFCPEPGTAGTSPVG